MSIRAYARPHRGVTDTAVHKAICAGRFKLARSERDAGLNWPARVTAQMAAQLGLEPHAIHVALETAVREHCRSYASGARDWIDASRNTTDHYEGAAEIEQFALPLAPFEDSS